MAFGLARDGLWNQANCWRKISKLTAMFPEQRLNGLVNQSSPLTSSEPKPGKLVLSPAFTVSPPCSPESYDAGGWGREQLHVLGTRSPEIGRNEGDEFLPLSSREQEQARADSRTYRPFAACVLSRNPPISDFRCHCVVS